MARRNTPTGPPPRAQYRVYLDRAVVAALRVRAARESLASAKAVSWADILRRAATEAAEGVK